MNRRIIWIVLGALLLVALVALLWWWFLGWGGTVPPTTGTFGSGGARTPSGGIAQPPTNVGTPLTPVGGYQIGATAPTARGGLGGRVGSTGSGSQSTSSATYGTPSGVFWPGGGPFTPTPINEVGNANPTSPTPSGGGNKGNSDLANALIAGAAMCSVFMAQAISGTLTTAIFAVQVNAPAANAKAFLDCMARVVARFALQQMTASILKWVNSGFNGQPAFVQSFQQLFLNVADVAAGQFIQGSALSFLCTPFQAPVRIAIAQSYARRGGLASSCTLSKALTGGLGSFNSFSNGNFSAGGWRGFLAYTTVPTNNAFGAYMYAQNGLSGSIAQAQQNTDRDLSYGRGFQSVQEKYDCVTDVTTKAQVCKTRIATPSSVVEPQTNYALGTSYRQLELAKSFDEIITLFIQQLIVSSLYGGLSNLNTSGSGAALPAEAQTLLVELQTAVSVAQQYGYTKQGSISDIQGAQSNLKNLANCFEGRGNSASKDTALAKIAELEVRITALNNQITQANSSIATLEGLMTRTLAARNKSDAGNIRTDFQSAIGAGALIVAADLTTAQQDRTTLQGEMATLNQQTSTSLNQCYVSP